MAQPKIESQRITITQEPHPALESVDDRMIGLMRLTLALSALIIIYIDPSEPDRLVAVTYIALVVYTLYSAALYILSVYHHSVFTNSSAPWIDIGCFLVFVSLSSGTSSIFLYFFFFAILVASFGRGFKTGIRVTIASSVLFTIIGYAVAPAGAAFELNRFLLRPVYLLVLGYMIAYWGESEIKHKQRLSFLREIIRLSNPRFGVSYTIGSMLQKLQAFYEADASFSKITVERADSTLQLWIANNNPHQNGGGRAAFVPRLITERTEELGGRVRVEQSLDGCTVVKVVIPL